MNDRELLELAAKAAGIRYTIEDDEYYKARKFFGLWLVYDDEPGEYARRYWNPLTNDGDALRLVVRLRLSPMMRTLGCDTTDLNGTAGAYEKWGDNPYAATRRAIVRAAAEIGRNMK